jgi:hypothetical protein
MGVTDEMDERWIFDAVKVGRKERGSGGGRLPRVSSGATHMMPFQSIAVESLRDGDGLSGRLPDLL